MSQNIETNLFYLKVALITGIMNIVGRLLAGILATTKRINTLILNNVALFIASGALFALPMFTTYTALLAFCIVYGLCMGRFLLLFSYVLYSIMLILRFFYWGYCTSHILLYATGA